MSYDKPVTASRETPIGDETHFIPEPTTHDGGRRTEHLTHARTTSGSLVPDHDHIAGAHRARKDRLRGAFLSLEHPGAPCKRQSFLAGNLRDRTFGCHIPIQNDEVA